MPSDEENPPRMRSKTSKKKKKSKAQSRSETSPSDMSSKAKRKEKMSQIGGDIDEEKALEYDGDMNDHTYNHSSQTRKKRDRKQKRNEEEQMAPHSGSNIGSSTVSSKRYNGRGRNNSQQFEHSESHYDNGYIDYDHGDYMSEMGNHDPIDEYGPEYDMSEEDEEEPRFKYSTADLSDGDFRDQKCCLIAAGAFFILIAIAVSVLMLKLPNKNDER